MLASALHEYCTSSTLFKRGIPLSFPQVYNMEDVPPAEVEIPLIGVLLKSQID